MAKITVKKNQERETITVKTTSSKKKADRVYAWWGAKNKDDMNNQLLSTASFLKTSQQYRYRQASIRSRLYSNYPLSGFVGANLQKLNLSTNLPADRPTLNVIQSCTDTLVSRITQSRPRPLFLTDDGDYKQRKLAKQLNNFISGEFYQCDAYQHGEDSLRDSCVLGDGVVKIFQRDDRVVLERRLITEILVDPNDAMYGRPRQLYELQLVDRSMLAAMFPKDRGVIERAEQAFPDNSADSSQTISDQVMVVEAWKLPSSAKSNDGLHVIGLTSGMIDKDEYNKKRFPFVISPYAKRMLGFDGQGLAEQLMGTQSEINNLLRTIQESIRLVGVPRVFVEEGSKVVNAHINNMIGAIVKYRGTKPTYEVAPCIAPEIYAQLQRLVEYAYQQCGVSTLSAAAQKPSGLNSGEAIRSYDDIQSDRFATVQKRYSKFYEDLAYLMFDTACDIADRTGSYSTVYPNKNGAKEINLPDIKGLKKDQFVIQCFDSSALPRDPAGRLQKITEMVQSGMIDIREGRRLLDYPDLDQVEKLANAGEERILQVLDKIVEDGEYTPPDPFMDLALAKTISVQYYNLYMAAKLEPDKAEMLRTFNTQVQALIGEAQAAMAPPPQPIPQAGPEPAPTNPLVQNVPGGP